MRMIGVAQESDMILPCLHFTLSTTQGTMSVVALWIVAGGQGKAPTLPILKTRKKYGFYNQGLH